MEKDILTIQNIQSDLRHQLRGTVICMVVCAVFFVLFFWLFLTVLDEPGAFFAILEVAIFLLMLLIIVIVCIKSIYEIRSVLEKPGSIVTDRVVGMETKDHMYKGVFLPRCDQTYHLRFTGYGEYVIPYHNFSWSDLHAMDADMVYFHAECGDEFYLVLSKPHTGKILLAYPAKMFALQQTEKEEKTA
jgi:hypothetical protein